MKIENVTTNLLILKVLMYRTKGTRKKAKIKRVSSIKKRRTQYRMTVTNLVRGFNFVEYTSSQFKDPVAEGFCYRQIMYHHDACGTP